MPVSPPRPCGHPGCPELVKSGLCDRHSKHQKQQQRQTDSQRGNSGARGYDRKWRKSRLLFLKQNPLCVQCQAEGKIEVASVVDHITPHRGDKQLFWKTDNWQSLCKHHHDIKTASGL